MSSELMYKEKYLKYKEKYFKLKKDSVGGIGSSWTKQAILKTGSFLGSQTSQGKRNVSNLFLKALELDSSIKKIKKDLANFKDFYDEAVKGDRESFGSYNIHFGENPDGTHKLFNLKYSEIIKFISLIHTPYEHALGTLNDKLVLDTSDLKSEPIFPKEKELMMSDWHRIATDINDNFASMTGSIYQTKSSGVSIVKKK
jgi:hypothetical protein